MTVHEWLIDHNGTELRGDATLESPGPARDDCYSPPVLGVLLAALSGLSYGASDFSGAMASKEDDASLVTVAMQAISLASLLVILVIWPEDHRELVDLAWAALGGVGAAVGLTTFYIALSRGPMTTAASITGLVGALVPVAAGLALGDRPSVIALAGIALSIPAVVMLSSSSGGLRTFRRRTTPRERVASQQQVSRTRALAVVAGLGFGLFFVALSRVSTDAGLFPLVGARVASIAALSAVITTRRVWKPLSRASWPFVVVAGILDCAANSFYLTALSHGTFTWVAAISSLYPVSTVLLARVVLKERLAAIQILGLAVAGGALVLIAIGR